MSILTKIIEVPLNTNELDSIRQRVLKLQQEIAKRQDELTELIKQVSEGKVIKTVKVVEEDNGIEIIGWHDGKILYSRLKSDDERQLELKITEPKLEQKEQSPVLTSIESDPLPEGAEFSLEEKLDPSFEDSLI